MTAISIEDLATTSDDAAVRRRFDARNLVWLTILLFPFFFGAFIELMTNLGAAARSSTSSSPPRTWRWWG